MKIKDLVAGQDYLASDNQVWEDYPHQVTRVRVLSTDPYATLGRYEPRRRIEVTVPGLDEPVEIYGNPAGPGTRYRTNSVIGMHVDRTGDHARAPRLIALRDIRLPWDEGWAKARRLISEREARRLRQVAMQNARADRFRRLHERLRALGLGEGFRARNDGSMNAVLPIESVERLVDLASPEAGQ